MTMTLPEMALLKATPNPYNAAPATRNDIYRAANRMLRTKMDERVSLKTLDKLEALRLIERAGGFFRRTFEGEELLRQAAKSLSDFTTRLIRGL